VQRFGGNFDAPINFKDLRIFLNILINEDISPELKFNISLLDKVSK